MGGGSKKAWNQESPEKGSLSFLSLWKSWERGIAKSPARGLAVTGLGETQGISTAILSILSSLGEGHYGTQALRDPWENTG